MTNYPAEALVNRTVVGALNLGSRRIAGFESQFLLLGGRPTPRAWYSSWGSMEMFRRGRRSPDGAGAGRYSVSGTP